MIAAAWRGRLSTGHPSGRASSTHAIGGDVHIVDSSRLRACSASTSPCSVIIGAPNGWRFPACVPGKCGGNPNDDAVRGQANELETMHGGIGAYNTNAN